MSIESLLSHVMGRPVAVTVADPDDLLAASEQREREGHLAELALRREEVRHLRMPALAVTEGPDPVVFGSVPRVWAGG